MANNRNVKKGGAPGIGSELGKKKPKKTNSERGSNRRTKKPDFYKKENGTEGRP